MIAVLRKLFVPRHGKNSTITTKNWVAYVLFGAIIVVFALWGVRPDQYGDSSGGVAAVVNNTSISMSEFRTRYDNAEKSIRQRFEQLPEAQRRALYGELRRRTLEELIQGELLFQAALERGIIASDAEVRNFILEIPFLQEGGRFVRDRYRAFLDGMNLSTTDFERQVRKQIVIQKLQDLFVGSALSSREDLKRKQMLSEKKVDVRFVKISGEELAKFAAAADLQKFLAGHKDEVQKYYDDHKIEFTQPEKFKARHILIRTSGEHSEKEAEKLIADLAKQANPANFASLATKFSEDPGSKVKGGDLGEFSSGAMVPEFENAARALNPGEISKPIKTNFGYHLIFLEKKSPSHVDSFDVVRSEIARKLYVKDKEGEIIAQVRKEVEAGDKKAVEQTMASSGFKWESTGEFDLAASEIPKIGDGSVLMTALGKQGAKPGLIRQVLEVGDSYLIAEVTSWKNVSAPALTPDAERMMALRKTNDLLEGWFKDVEAKASIQRNPRL